MSCNERLKLYLEHRSELINYACALLSAREAAEDIVQEAWLKFACLPLEHIEQPTGYLFRMVRNLAMDELRSQQSVRRLEQVAPEPAQDPLHTVSSTMELERVQKALDQMSEPMRRAFEMHRFAGATLNQIAEQLGVSPSSAHRYVQQAMLQCLAALDKNL